MTNLLDSKDCEYWIREDKKIKFLNSISNQMLNGDCFELIDGRTLEMRSEILREIAGEIESKKCIVVTVIGP